ncbi:coiled-coil domain-containing protein 175 [Pungitius pungitius]|uniref:coiled-coil domain-containing protein 175 n=1 Tax=Pungitius pungitius TaxID=134920 RepID=UPI002E10C3BB
MASCRVPDFPALMVAVERLKELEKQIMEDDMPFSAQASLHLTKISAAITELEADRRVVHELLEVETIENSKLRHHMNNTRERMSREMMADVAAARASNSEEIEQLKKHINTVSQLQEATVKRQETLFRQNEALCPQREQVKAEHEEVIAVQNEQITLKYMLQRALDETRDRIEELKSCTAAAKQDKLTLQQKMVLEREAFTLQRDHLSKCLARAEGRVKQQKQSIRRGVEELDRQNVKEQETHDRLGQLMIDVAKLESKLRKLAASRCQYGKQLRGETQKLQELSQQREILKTDMRELREAFRDAAQRLKEHIATVETKIEEGRASRLLHQDSLAQIYEMFKHQRDEEDGVRAEHFHVLQQLERSKLQLEDRIASKVKHSNEIKEMDKQIQELLEADTITKRMFERNQGVLCNNIDTEKKNICHFEEEERRLTRMLAEARRKQEEHVAKITSDISSTRRRYQQLRQEEMALEARQPESTNADLLMSNTAQRESKYRQEESKHHEEIEQLAAKALRITRSHVEKQKEVEEQEELLNEVVAKWNEEQSRQRRINALTSELRGKREHLELLIGGLKERTGSLLQPKEEMKARLEELRGRYKDALDQRASQLGAVEVSLYEDRADLEQVGLENSRLRLCVSQMTGDADRVREDTCRYRREAQRLQRDTEASSESLRDAWNKDSLVTRDHQNSDGGLLVSMGGLLNHLQTRAQQLGNVSTLLHHQSLDFSRRLGYKTITTELR